MLRTLSKLDFLIIGAQKSGTTTLFKLLSEHPEIYMPSGKEAPFFTKNIEYAKGLPSYTKTFFLDASPNQLWGTATPHYLSDPRVPERILNTVPEVKLVAILRNPAERALSHYRMSVRRGFEKRSFEDAISEMLGLDSLENARSLPTGYMNEDKTYVVWGEYGRLINNYLKFFARNKILILFTDELAKSPEITIKKILDFLDLSEHEFSSLGKRFHEGGTSERLPFLKKLKRFDLIRSVWQSLSPNLRSKVMYAVNQLNTVKSSDSLDNYDQTMINQLKTHYLTDIKELEKAIGCSTPWNN